MRSITERWVIIAISLRAPAQRGQVSTSMANAYLLAYDAKLCSAARRIFVRTLLGWLRERAESAGITAGLLQRE